MSVNINDLVAYCDQLLQVGRFRDYAPNGLQVEGRQAVKRVISGVTASQALLDAAVEWQADLVLVHHGYFWEGEPQAVTGIKQRRLKTLLLHDINLVAYHLPLDAHPQLGNNAQLAELLGLSVDGPLEPGAEPAIGNIGQLAQRVSLKELTQRIAAVLGREPQVIRGGEHDVQKVAWCTGAAERMIEHALVQGADVYISGEISEPVVHIARET